MVKHIAQHDHLPDYRLAFDEETRSWSSSSTATANGSNAPCPRMARRCRPCPTEAYDDGRAAAPGYDIHGLESEWREWWASSGKPKLDNPAAAFVGFCRSRHKRAPIQREADREWPETPALPQSAEAAIEARGCVCRDFRRCIGSATGKALLR